MGGWWLLGIYLAGWALLLVSPFLRRRTLLLPGTRLASAHLLLAAAILADGAIRPEGPVRSAAPLLLSLAAALAAFLFRDTWLLLGRPHDPPLRLLEEICRTRGVDLVQNRGGLILKRLGTGVSLVALARGVGLVRLDRRRREPEVDRIGQEWRRVLSRRAGGVIRVAAGILSRGDRILICQRKRDGPFPLRWEFPGGKLGTGESAESALCRELAEELSVAVACRDLRKLEVIRHRYPGGPEVELHFFRVTSFEGEIVNLAFEILAWAEAADLGSYDFLEADRPLVARIAAGGVGSL